MTPVLSPSALLTCAVVAQEATKASTAQMELLELTSAGSHHAPEPAAADRLRLLQAAVVELGEMRLGVADDVGARPMPA